MDDKPEAKAKRKGWARRRVSGETVLDGAYLRSLRESRGMSQLELSERLGITQTHVSKLELGNQGAQPSIDVALKIADLFEADLNRLFRRSSPSIDGMSDTGRDIVRMLGMLSEDNQRVVLEITQRLYQQQGKGAALERLLREELDGLRASVGDETVNGVLDRLGVYLPASQ